MVDSLFYNSRGPFTLKKISESIGCPFKGNDDKIIKDLATIEDANSDQICFLAKPKYNKFKFKFYFKFEFKFKFKFNLN